MSCFKTLLHAIREEASARMVFTSSAAMPVCPDVDLVTENTPTLPINPYGGTELTCGGRGVAGARGARGPA